MFNKSSQNSLKFFNLILQITWKKLMWRFINDVTVNFIGGYWTKLIFWGDKTTVYLHKFKKISEAES